MNAEDFRRIARGMAGAVEGAHMGHPDFRVAWQNTATTRAAGRPRVVKAARATRSSRKR
jgi:hypothetical protein